MPERVAGHSRRRGRCCVGTGISTATATAATSFAWRTITSISSLATTAAIAALPTRRPIGGRCRGCLVPSGQRRGRIGNERLRDGLVIGLRRPWFALTRFARRTRLTLGPWFAGFAGLATIGAFAALATIASVCAFSALTPTTVAGSRLSGDGRLAFTCLYRCGPFLARLLLASTFAALLPVTALTALTLATAFASFAIASTTATAAVSTRLLVTTTAGIAIAARGRCLSRFGRRRSFIAEHERDKPPPQRRTCMVGRHRHCGRSMYGGGGRDRRRGSGRDALDRGFLARFLRFLDLFLRDVVFLGLLDHVE